MSQHWRIVKRAGINLAFLTIALAVFALICADVIPPRSLTVTHMEILKRRLLRYAQLHGELPKSLADLPKLEGYDNGVQDGWKRDIIYEVSRLGVVTLRSLGRDGIAGGVGEDADLVRSFPARDVQGRWNSESVSWSGDTFERRR